MLQFFLNPLMLLGLAGVALPVIAHLLSRRKFDIVEWGAMQFLDPSRRTRRRLKLEELLLLLVRIGLIFLLAFAAARPWIDTGFLTGYRSGGSRDVVLVIDGSNSMARSDGLTTLHQKAVKRAIEFLDTLQPGDTVAVIDARDRPVAVIESPIHDRDLVRDSIVQLAPPSGAANLQAAGELAVGMLSRSSNGRREIIVLTDRQRAGWAVENDPLWKRFDDLLSFPSVRPRFWVVDISDGLAPLGQNIAVGRLDLSRDLTVPGFPVRFRVAVRNSGSTAVVVPLHVLVDGQRLAEKDTSVSVPANSDAVVELEYRFPSEGTRRLSVQADVPNDPLLIDNSADAAVRVTSAIPVLLVESSRSLVASEGHTFFAAAALTAPQNKSPWVKARVVRASDVTADDVTAAAVVVLPDVDRLPDGISEVIRDSVKRGSGVFISLGPDTTPAAFNALFVESGLLPAMKLTRIREVDPDAPEPTRVLPYSLQAGWLDRFRAREDSSFLKASYEKWWLADLSAAPVPSNDADGEALVDELDDDVLPAEPPIALAQLATGDPLLFSVRCGRGTVLISTTTLDTRWNNLPARPDFVPFIHEAIFQMASSKVRRNVSFGEPLLATLPLPANDMPLPELKFDAPFNRRLDAELSTGESESIAMLARTTLPGVYELRPAGRDADVGSRPIDSFVVNYDHSEDDSAELNDDDRSRLIVNNRMTFVDSTATLARLLYGDESHSELWALLMFSFLGMLVFELWMTRRLVLRGHGGLEGQ
ncbi:MAG: VWA domain-containing protein [Planctomycetaceae bacterium]